MDYNATETNMFNQITCDDLADWAYEKMVSGDANRRAGEILFPRQSWTIGVNADGSTFLI